ncbi:MAG: tetratricopeptide repeat protein [Oscillatoriales cyanobacterium]|nr:MAG: tetratricopeptide repeat protein [Oscillatoriales cyanobacterium]
MTDRPAALPAAPEVEFFLARTEEQRRFRELLRSQVGLSRRRKLLNTIGLMRDDREPDPHPNSPWIFLFHGEGGMGKSTLIRRLMAIAEGKLRDKNPGDRAWVDRFTILKIDWETERTNRPSLQGPRDQIAESAVLDVLFDQAALKDQSCFKNYEQRLKDLKAASEKVSDKLQTEQQGGNAGVSKALAIAFKVGLRWLKLDDVVKDYGDQIDAATEFAPQVTAWAKTKLTRQELEVLERPDQKLADALGKGLAKLAAQKPVLMFLDTYEVVDRPECDAIVRLVMQAAGGRVSWVVSGRSNLRNSGKRGEIYFKGYGDDFPEAKLYAKALDEFGEAEIREYFARKVPDPPIDDADAQAIREFSLGIPFMVAEIASIWRDRPNLTLKQILAPAPADETKTPRDRAIAAMTERFLVHCLRAGDGAAALGQDLAAIYSLAMVRRPDRSLLAVMLQTEDLSAALAHLQTRYSFVFADDCRLHDNLLNYLQPYLRMAAQRERPTVQALNDRALAHLGGRLAAKAEELPELADRFESDNAKALWLDVAHHHFWKAQDPDQDEIAAWKFWLGAFVEGWLADRAFARELVQVLGQFERCLSADGRRRYQCFQGDWDKRRDFDCDQRRALLDELDKLARRGWLATDNPERAATLELERARLLYGQKQYVTALQALEALDRRHPDPSKSLREAIADLYDDLASRFLWPEGKTSAVPSPEGLRAAERACALQIDRAWYLYRQAVALNEAKRHEEAVEIYQRAIELDPNFVYTHNGLGAAYRDLKRYEEAIAAYQRAIELDPNFVYAHNGLGNAYYDLKRYEEAIAACQQAIELDPNEAIYHNNLGLAYRDLKRYEEAIAAYQRAIELDPNYASPHNGLGNAYRNLKRYEEAIAAYQRAIELEPNEAIYHNNLGLAYGDLKRYEEAIAAKT